MMGRIQILFMVLIFIGCGIYLIAEFSGKLNWSSTALLNRSSLPNGTKLIAWENKPDWPWIQDISFKNCAVKSCAFTARKEEADVVIIYMVNYHLQSPFHRPLGQIWAVFGLEPPHLVSTNVWSNPAWQSQINWTMTYRLDSTIFFPYYQPSRPIQDLPNLKGILSKKSRLVAAVVSNCYLAPSKRLKYIQFLQRHLKQPIDVYGNCGTLMAGQGYDWFKTISVKYKFYLAFENSLCKDYITEKFFGRQNLNWIVIARGSGNYSQFYPKQSYIDTRDFKTTKDLADYIQYLDKNDTAYLEYLSNKLDFKARSDAPEPFCEICKRLHEPLVPTHYANIWDWFSKNACSEPQDII
ncbi:3-galactosyl-N-acetylglucosaminide 4-alpha-L-fucosyltransferase FUT3 isoform X2 [Patella vulgata]|uniref:3-galactosyl-N-acetylglucosaminide 4-alpha-L-fucosyltransferase FUT3 isoform X2 n=1 Tax=Patella vulgata TaxID=6465 RepID=UPI0024A9FC71|nr:3-galactosyl-N-acetylglucosaminide 4-alpha-L-fucosyltransferase FUT3 isoform X2 [Patella vulgata]